MICFVAAMEKEVAPIIERCGRHVIALGQGKLHICENEGRSFGVLVSGIGKCAAAMAVATLLATRGKEIEAIVNVGVAGSLDEATAPMLSCLIGSRYVQHDVDTRPIGDPLGMISGINVIYFPAAESLLKTCASVCRTLGLAYEYGDVASGDQFIASPEQKEKILDAFPSTVSIDMESAAFAQACYGYGVPYVAARFISDSADGGEYEANFPKCRNAIESFVLTYVRDNA